MCSNLFENITDKYDYIIFNPPYVPTSIGEKLNLKDYQKTAQDRLAWDGVKDGMSLIEKFLEEGFQYLNKNGKIILGVQGLYITREKIQNCILKKEHIYLANI